MAQTEISTTAKFLDYLRYLLSKTQLRIIRAWLHSKELIVQVWQPLSIL